MREFGVDLIVHVLVTAVSVVGALGLTAIGVLVDRAGLENLFLGSFAQGAWELWMGSLAIFVGLYLLGYRTAWPALTGHR